MEAPELKQLIQESVRETVREVLREERLTLWMALLPHVSHDEMQEIQAQFGVPTDYATDEFANMTDWVRHGN
ncbi:hypothetical protein PN441_00950 [Spirulina major CS-329]|uniref:hypothetical protein n=1 Tax=Spirulina TaxID=1154 RepID=UPI00232B1617|nr:MULTISPECIES: hypothetical protein [Spirulina]MDB9493758.1 hypothetical protein [Spirulina subsalsa CS-330]MDB9501621.1 hypothetical protein [Spirulina major CS-329]